MNKKRTISASEVGTYAFCPRAWGLEQLGYHSANQREMVRGTAFHRSFGRREILMRTLTILLILVGLCLLAVTVRYFLK